MQSGSGTPKKLPEKKVGSPSLAESVEKFWAIAENVEKSSRKGELLAPPTNPVMRRNSMAASSSNSNPLSGSAMQRRESIAGGGSRNQLRPTTLVGNPLTRRQSIAGGRERSDSVVSSGSGFNLMRGGAGSGQGSAAVLPPPENFLQYDSALARKPTPYNPKKLNSLQLAAYNGDINKLRSLMFEKKRDLDKLDTVHGVTALQIAAERGDIKMAKALIDGVPIGNGETKRCSLNPKNREGRTALQMAAMMMHSDVLILLLTYRANSDLQDSIGCVPLHWAILHNDRASFSALCRSGAKVQIQDKTKNSLLHHATRFGNPEFVTQILDMGADVDFANAELRTPLHIAVENKCDDLIQILIEHNADPTLVDYSGRKAIDYVDPDEDNEELIQLLTLKELARHAKAAIVKKDFLGGDIELEGSGSLQQPKTGADETSTDPVEIMGGYNVKKSTSSTKSTDLNVGGPDWEAKRRRSSSGFKQKHPSASSDDDSSKSPLHLSPTSSRSSTSERTRKRQLEYVREQSESTDPDPLSTASQMWDDLGLPKGPAGEHMVWTRSSMYDLGTSEGEVSHPSLPRGQLLFAEEEHSRRQPSLTKKDARLPSALRTEVVDDSESLDLDTDVLAAFAGDDPSYLSDVDDESRVGQTTGKSRASISDTPVLQAVPSNPEAASDAVTGSGTVGRSVIDELQDFEAYLNEQSTHEDPSETSGKSLVTPTPPSDIQPARRDSREILSPTTAVPGGEDFGTLDSSQIDEIIARASREAEAPPQMGLKQPPPRMTVRIDAPETTERHKLEPGEMTATANRLMMDLKRIEQQFVGQEDISHVVQVLAGYVRETNEIAIAAEEEQENYRLLWTTVQSEYKETPERTKLNEKGSPEREEVVAWVNTIRTRRNTDATIAGTPTSPMRNNPKSPDVSALNKVERRHAQLTHEVESLQTWIDYTRDDIGGREDFGNETVQERKDREVLKKNANALEQKRAALFTEYASLHGQSIAPAEATGGTSDFTMSYVLPKHAKGAEAEWETLLRQLAAERSTTLRLKDEIEGLNFDYTNMKTSKLALEARLDDLQERFVQFNLDLDAHLTGTEDDHEQERSALDERRAQELKAEVAREREISTRYKDELTTMQTKLRILEISRQDLEMQVTRLQQHKCPQAASSNPSLGRPGGVAGVPGVRESSPLPSHQHSQAGLSGGISSGSIGPASKAGVEKLTRERDSLHKQLDELRARIDTHVCEMPPRTQEEENEVSEKLREELRNVMDEFRRQMDEERDASLNLKSVLQSTIEQLQVEKDALVQQLNEIQQSSERNIRDNPRGGDEQNTVAEKLREELRVVASDFQRQVSEERDVASNLKQMLQGAIDNLQAEKEALMQQLGDIQKSHELNDRPKALTDQAELADRLRDELRAIKRKYDSAKTEREVLQNRLSELEEEQAQQEILNEEMKELLDHVHVDEQKMNDLAVNLADATAELESSRARIAQLEREKLERGISVGARADIPQVRNRDLDTDHEDSLVKQLNENLTSATTELASARDEQAALQTLIKEMESQGATRAKPTKRGIDHHAIELDSARGQHEAMQNRIKELESQIVTADHSLVKQLNGELQRTSAELGAALRQIKVMEDQIQQHQERDPLARNLQQPSLQLGNTHARGSLTEDSSNAAKDLQDHLTRSSKDLNAAHKRIAVLESQIAAHATQQRPGWEQTQKELQQLTDEINTFSLEDDLSQSERDLVSSDQKATIVDLEEQLEALQAGLLEGEMERQELEARLIAADARDAEQMVAIRQERDESVSETYRLGVELQSTVDALATETSARKRLVEELRTMQATLESLQMDLAEARVRVDTSTITDSHQDSDQVEDFVREREASSAEISILAATVTSLTIALQEESNRRKHLITEFEALQANFEAVQMDLGETRHSANDHHKQLESLTHALRDREEASTRERDENVAETQALTSTLSALTIKLEEQTTAREELSEKVRELQEECEKLQMDLGGERSQRERAIRHADEERAERERVARLVEELGTKVEDTDELRVRLASADRDAGFEKVERERLSQLADELQADLEAAELDLDNERTERERTSMMAEELHEKLLAVEAALAAEKSELEKTVQQAEHQNSTIQTLNAEVESNRQAIATLTNESLELRTTLQDMTSKAKAEANEDLVQYYDTEMRLLATQIAAEKDARTARDAEHVRISQTVSELEANLAHAQEEHQVAATTAAHTEKTLNDNLTKLTARVAALGSEVEQKAREIATLQDDLVQRDQKIASLESDIAQGETRKTLLTDKFNALRTDHDTLQSEHSLQSNAMREKTAQLEALLKESVIKRERMEAELFTSTEEVTELRGKVLRLEARQTRSTAEIQEHLLKLETFEADLSKERSHRMKLEEKNVASATDLEKSLAKIEAAEAAASTAQTKLQSLEREREGIQSDLAASRAALSRANEEHERLEKDSQQKLAALETTHQQRIAQWDTERGSLQAQIQQTSTRNTDLQQSVEKGNETARAAEAHVRELEHGSAKLQEELHRLQSDKERIDLLCKGLNESVAQSQAQLTVLREENIRVQTLSEKATTEAQGLKNEVDRLQNDKATLQKRLNEAKSRAESLQSQHKHAISEKKRLQNELEELREKATVLEEKYVTAQTEAETRKREIKKLSEGLVSSKEENEQKTVRIEKLEEDSARLDRALKFTEAGSSESRASMEVRLHDLTRQLDTITRERDTLKEETDRIKGVLEVRISESLQDSAKRSVAANEIQSLREQVAELGDRLLRKDVEVADLTDKIRDRAAATKLKEQERELECDLAAEELRKQMAIVATQMQTNQTEADEALRKTRDQISDLSTKLQARETEIRELGAKISAEIRAKQELVSATAELERKLKTTSERLSESEVSVKAAEELASERRQRVDILAKELTRRKGEVHELQQALDTIHHDHAAETCELKTQLLSVSRTREGLSARLTDAQAAVEKAQMALAELEHSSARDRAELERQLAIARASSSSFEADQSRGAEELKLIRTALDRTHLQMGVLTNAQIQWDLERQDMHEVVLRKESMCKQMQTNFDNTREALTASEVRVVTLEAETRRLSLEIQALKSLKHQWETERIEMAREFEERAANSATRSRDLEKTTRMYKEATIKIQALESALFEGVEEFQRGAAGAGDSKTPLNKNASILSLGQGGQGPDNTAVFKTVAQLQHQLTLARERQAALEKELEEERAQRAQLEQQWETTRSNLQAEMEAVIQARDDLAGQINDANRHSEECENEYLHLLDTDATGLRAQIRDARQALLASAERMRALQEENSELAGQLVTMQESLSAKQTLNTAPRVMSLEQENARLRSTIARLRSDLSRMEVDVRRSYDAKVRRIVTTLDEHTKERNVVEKGWIRNQDKLKDGYERQIQTLSGELAGLKKKTVDGSVFGPPGVERTVDWDMGVKAKTKPHAPARTSSHFGHHPTAATAHCASMESHLQILYRHNRNIERKLESISGRIETPPDPRLLPRRAELI
ncbi:hypothetical protein HKX48_002595 [Thoreauomyces humboldtii]|nr:hypothetical protein HKX48_002595 [Thoreauomyces humboldtii]